MSAMAELQRTTSGSTERNPIVVRRELRNYASQLFDYTLKLLDQTANPDAASPNGVSHHARTSDSTTRRQREGSGSSATSSGVGASDEVYEGRRSTDNRRSRDYQRGDLPTRV